MGQMVDDIQKLHLLWARFLTAALAPPEPRTVPATDKAPLNRLSSKYVTRDLPRQVSEGSKTASALRERATRLKPSGLAGADTRFSPPHLRPDPERCGGGAAALPEGTPPCG
ncbi:hypothetical protein J1605_015271 [Eschrichtius robustus]|uniref:Uncharacterized protein n=1 Tax=Eschrichtius robustus TaxID=9764 RepID=A0AB34GBH5_ESCRO|nr:hypothetical protein J1605_015271 [Eschrichtius robustus]